MRGTKDYLFHKVRSVRPLPDFRLSVEFRNGETKIYDVKACFERWPAFQSLKTNPRSFNRVKADPDGFCVIWNSELDLGCNELYNHGLKVETPFDHIVSMQDVMHRWGIKAGTLRRALKTGELLDNIDARLQGNVWFFSSDAIKRVYGSPKDESLET